MSTERGIELVDVLIDSIEIDDGLQLRARTCEATVADYAADMLAGDEFPPVRLFRSGENGSARYWIGDGNHRVRAARALKREKIRANVSPGNRADALKYAFTANIKSGLRLSAEDRIHRIEVALATYPEMSTRALADWLRVRRSAIETVREAGGTVSKGRLGRDGRVRSPIRRAELRREQPVPEVPTLSVTPAGGGRVVSWGSDGRMVETGYAAVAPAYDRAPASPTAVPANLLDLPPGGVAVDDSFLAKFSNAAPGRERAEREASRRADEERARVQADLAIDALLRISGDNRARAGALETVRAWIEEEQRKAAAGEPPDTAEARGEAEQRAEVSKHNEAALAELRESKRPKDEEGRFTW